MGRSVLLDNLLSGKPADNLIPAQNQNQQAEQLPTADNFSSRSSLLNNLLAGKPADKAVEIAGHEPSVITSEPLTPEEITGYEKSDRRHKARLAYQAMTPQQRWLQDKGYPTDFEPLMKSAPDINTNANNHFGLVAGMTIPRKRSLDETFRYNYEQLDSQDPLRQKVDKIHALQDAYAKELTKLEMSQRRQFKGFWDELGRSIASGSLNVASGLTGTLASVSDAAIWDKQQVEDLAGWLHKKSTTKALAPAAPAEGKWGKVKQFTANAIGQALPYMAASTVATIATGTPVAAFGVGFSVEGDNAYREAIEAGASEEHAQMNRFIVGTLNGAIESLQVSDVIKFAKNGRGSVKSILKAARQRAWKEVLTAGKELSYQQLEHILRESLEEALQETVSVGAQATVDPTVLENAGRRIGSAALGGGVAGGVLGMGGSFLTSNNISEQDVKVTQTEDGWSQYEFKKSEDATKMSDWLTEQAKQQQVDAEIEVKDNVVKVKVGQVQETEEGKPALHVNKKEKPVPVLKNTSVVEVPVENLKLSKEVLNFKENADPETGVVKGEQLSGEYNKLGTAPIVVWQRNNGDMEVVTGRHRLDLARRNNEKTIPAQIVKEAEGFDKAMALTIDAESNIRDGQGKVKDYAQYFRNTEITQKEAEQRGLLARFKGKAGFVIGKSSVDDVYSRFLAGKISERKTYAIAEGAPNNESAQLAAATKADKMSADELRQYAQILNRTKPSDNVKATQGNLFGFDESALIEAEAVAKEVAKEERAIKERILAVRGALKRPETAKKMGLEFSDEASIRKEVQRLENRLDDLSRFATSPELHQKMRRRAGLEEEPTEQKTEEPKRQADLLGRPVLQGGASGKQTEFLDKEDYKTLQEKERINTENDVEGQGSLLNKKTANKDIQKYEQSNPDYVINIDRAKLLLKGYDSADIANERKFYGKAAEITNKIYNKWLKNRQGKGNNVVLFTGGGTGSGKSTIVDVWAKNEEHAIVVDSTLTSKKYAIEQIDKAIKAGFEPKIGFVYRDPVDAWENGIWQRYEEGGHFVPANIFLNTHIKSRQNLIELAEKYGDKLDIEIVENESGKEPVEISLDELKSKSYDLERIKEQINAISKNKLKQFPGIDQKEIFILGEGNSGNTQGSQQQKPSVVKEAESQAEQIKSLPIPVSPDDIDYQRAYDAHRNTSFTPEKRAEQVQTEYINEMQSLYSEMQPLAQTREQKQVLKEQLQSYKTNYIFRMNSILDAKSRTASSMITGPSNFPVARNQKRLDIEQKRIDEFLAWREKAKKAIKNKLLDARSNEQIQSDTLNKLKKDINNTIAVFKNIENGEKGYSKSLFVSSLAGKFKTLAKNGEVKVVRQGLEYLREVQTKMLQKPVFTDRHSVWKLADNIVSQNKPVQPESGTEVHKKYQRVIIQKNYDINRVQLVFNEKPSDEVRKQLKSYGWRWSPKENAWQRKLTNNALANAEHVLNKHFTTTDEQQTESSDPTVDVPSKQGGFVGGRPRTAANAQVSAIIKEDMSTGSKNADTFLRRTKGFVNDQHRKGPLRNMTKRMAGFIKGFHFLTELPKTTSFADIREAFRHIMEVPKLSYNTAIEKMKWALTPVEGTSKEARNRMQAVRMKLIADDLHEDLEKGIDLPPELSADDITTMKTRANELYQKYPTVRESYDRICQATKEITDMLVEEDWLNAEQAKEFYYPHKVIKYLRAEDSFFGGITRKPSEPRKAYLRQRKGGFDYSTDVLERLVEHWAQVRRDIGTSRFLTKVLKKEQANHFKQEYPEWTQGQPVPSGFKEVTVLPGRYYYKTHGVTEDLATALVEQKLASIEELITESERPKIRKMLAVGKKRSFVVREEIARQLLDMPTAPVSEADLYNIIKSFNTFVKRNILFNPLYAIPFHVTNFTGDAHKVLTALPSALKSKHLVNYWKAIIDAHKGNKPELFEKAQEYGVIGSGWLGVDVKSMEVLIPEIERAELSGASEVLLNKLKRLFNALKVLGESREDWLRYALFERLMDMQTQGVDIIKYAVKDTTVVKGIADPVQQAAKIARDIMGDYSAIGKSGVMLSDLVVPFYRWMHLNLPWWPRMIKEYLKRGNVGRLTAAMIAASAPYILSNLWNYSDPDRRKFEKSLPYWKRWNFHIVSLHGKKMYYIPLPLDDVLNFIGVPEHILDFQRYQRGMINFPQLVKRIAINSAYKPSMSVINSVGGFFGVIRDISGIQTFPEIKPWLDIDWSKKGAKRKALKVSKGIFGAPGQLAEAYARGDQEKVNVLLWRSVLPVRPYIVDIDKTREILLDSVYKRSSKYGRKGEAHKGKQRKVDSLRIQLEGEQ